MTVEGAAADRPLRKHQVAVVPRCARRVPRGCILHPSLHAVMVGLVTTIQPSTGFGARGEMDPRDKPEDDRCGRVALLRLRALRLHQRHPRGGGGPGHGCSGGPGDAWVPVGSRRSVSRRGGATRLHHHRLATLSPPLAAVAHFAHPGSPRGASSSGALADAGRGLSRRVARNYPGPGAMVIGSVKQLPARRRGSQAELS